MDGMRQREDRRRVYRIEEMPPEQLAALEKAEVSTEYDYLNAELKDWKSPVDDIGDQRS